MRFFAGPTLLVIDKLGYLPLPAEAASALFQVINQRYLKTSIALTTNSRSGELQRARPGKFAERRQLELLAADAAITLVFTRINDAVIAGLLQKDRDVALMGLVSGADEILVRDIDRLQQRQPSIRNEPVCPFLRSRVA